MVVIRVPLAEDKTGAIFGILIVCFLIVFAFILFSIDISWGIWLLLFSASLLLWAIASYANARDKSLAKHWRSYTKGSNRFANKSNANTEVLRNPIPPTHEIIDEKVDSIVLKLEMPGITRDSIQVDVEGQAIIVEAEIKNSTYFYQYKTLLSTSVRSEGIKGRFRDDVLELRLIKKIYTAGNLSVCPYCHDRIVEGHCVFCQAWVCHQCKSINEVIASKCNRCGTFRKNA